LEARQGQGPWAGVLLSDEEALQIIAVLADVLDGHDVREPSAPPGRCLATAWAPKPAWPTPTLGTWPASTGDWLRPRPWTNHRRPPRLPPS
jgi:hypothetical protein